MEMSSDCESIRTEDFAIKFTEILNTDSKDSGFSCSKSERCLTPTINGDEDSQKPPPLELSFVDEGIQVDKSRSRNTLPPKRYTPMDLDSIATEMFEDHFRAMFGVSAATNGSNDNQTYSGRSFPADSCTTSLTFDVGNLSNVQPIRRDILNKFLAKYSMENKDMTSHPIRPIQSRQLTKSVIQSPSRAGHQMLNKEVFSDTNSFKSSNRQYGALFKNKSALAEEIRAKSMRIQEEIHDERRRKHETIPLDNNNNSNNNSLTNASNNKVANNSSPREKLDVKVRELDLLTDRMRQARNDRERISAELDQLRSQMKPTNPNGVDKSRNSVNYDNSKFSNNLNGLEARNNNNKCNGLVNNAMTSNPASQNHFVFLNQQLNQKKTQLEELEAKIYDRMKDIRNLEAAGLNRKEIEQVIEERNELYEILRQTEEQGQDKYELEKMLTESQEQLTMEHKKWKEQICNLEEQLDGTYKKLNAIYGEKEQLQKDVDSMKESMKYREEEINELYYERNELRQQLDKAIEEIESEKISGQEMLGQERKRFESHLATQEAQTKLSLSDLKNQISGLQDDLQSQVDHNKSMKHRVAKLEEERNKLNANMDNQESQHKESLQKVIDEYNSTVEKLKKEFYNSKENEIQLLKNEFDSEQMKTINNLRECYKQQVMDLQVRLEGKSQECQDLRTEVRKMKSEYSDKEESLRQTHDNQLSSWHNEHQRTIDSMERNKVRDVDEIKERYDNLMSKMKSELEEERSLNASLRNAVDKSNKDLSKEIETNKRQKQDKNVAIHKIKELAKQKLVEECKKIREYYEKELEDQLRTIEQVMEDRSCQMTARSKELEKQYHEENSALQAALQQILTDFILLIKEHCMEMSKIAKFHPPIFKTIKYENLQEITELMNSMKHNFQLCSQEYLQYTNDNLDKIVSDKDETIKLMQEKSNQEGLTIKNQIIKDHVEEINMMKANHNQEMITVKKHHEQEIEKMKVGVKEWKSKTAERLAHKLHKEFRKEMERKHSAREGRSTSSLNSYRQEITNNESKPIGLIEDLRTNIRQLREENLSLRKSLVDRAGAVHRSPRQDSLMADEPRYQKVPSSPERGNGSHGSSNNITSSSIPIMPASNTNNSRASPISTSQSIGPYKRPQSACPECLRHRNSSKDELLVPRTSSFKSFRN